MKTFISLITFSLMASLVLPGQTQPFDIEIYKDFMNTHEDIPLSELYQLFPSDVFQESVPVYETANVLFLDEMSRSFSFTTEEKTLLTNHGFMVTERLQAGSYFGQFMDVYKKDLPVFVSTDAILHAFHLSYDELLKQVELSYLIPELKKLLANAHSNLNSLEDKYDHLEEIKPMLHDVDVYLTVAKRLLGGSTQAFYPENEAVVSEYLTLVEEEQMKGVLFFSENMYRDIDFSQFKPRGHYEGEEWDENELPEYFRAMMWLGRMELYLDHPDYYDNEGVRATVHRQIVDAVLINELLSMEGNAEVLRGMEDIISFFVGDQDNLSPESMNQLIQECEINSSVELLDDSNIDRFLDSLRQKPFARQQILSQVFMGNNDGTSRPLPSTFMPFGQRFVIDSYVTGQVVYDRIIQDGGNICRLVPSTLDIMFAMGNDAALQLLIPELHKWHYSDNLAGLRFLIDQYEDEFWESSLYNLWLYAIESLNPDPGNEDLPEFMKTAAWGLEKLNSQLASWAELRHDNLLYAKQSYTGGNACSHPEGYVEPNPEFFGRMKRLTEIAGNKFATIDKQISWPNDKNPITFFQRMWEICDNLQIIANKELSDEGLSEAECCFLDDVTFGGFGGSGGEPSGWYVDLVYGGQNISVANLVVADYHTTPTDCIGNPLGWVSHAGTGSPDMAIVVAPLANGELCVFAGPVASYHEYKTNNFQRLSDSEWEASYLEQSLRPEWVYGYLADQSGHTKESSLKLFSDMESLNKALQTGIVSTRAVRSGRMEADLNITPNPVIQSTIISFGIPEEMRNAYMSLGIYNIEGKLLKKLEDGPLSPGNYLTRWDRTDEAGSMVPPGLYILRIEQGGYFQSAKLLVVD